MVYSSLDLGSGGSQLKGQQFISPIVACEEAW